MMGIKMRVKNGGGLDQEYDTDLKPSTIASKILTTLRAGSRKVAGKKLSIHYGTTCVFHTVHFAEAQQNQSLAMAIQNIRR